jgi:hypothetical protein
VEAAAGTVECAFLRSLIGTVEVAAVFFPLLLLLLPLLVAGASPVFAAPPLPTGLGAARDPVAVVGVLE